MAKSPLMFGGDMRKLDDTTYSLITNPTALEINAFSSNNQEACFSLRVFGWVENFLIFPCSFVWKVNHGKLVRNNSPQGVIHFRMPDFLPYSSPSSFFPSIHPLPFYFILLFSPTFYARTSISVFSLEKHFLMEDHFRFIMFSVQPNGA